MAVPVEKLADHVVELGRQFKVNLYLDKSVTSPRYVIDTHTVESFKVESEFAYAVALHELGHAIHPSGRLGESRLTTPNDVQEREEINAWTWARNYALCWTPEMERAYIIGMTNYTMSAVFETHLGPMVKRALGVRHAQHEPTPPRLDTPSIPYKPQGESISSFLRRKK